MEKQILAVCEISDHQIRLIVAEFFNTRLNILKVEQVNTTGFDGKTIIDESALLDALNKAVVNASKNLQASLTHVLLVIPAVGFARYVDRKVVACKSGFVTTEDIASSYRLLMQSSLPLDKEMIFIQLNKYLINQVAFRKAPIKEKADQLVVEADLYAADKALTYQLAGLIEKAGLQISDIVLDSWALAKEAALLEQSLQQAVIAIRLDQNQTQLNLYHQSKLLSSEWLEMGVGHWVVAIKDHFGLPLDVSEKLMQYNADLTKSTYSDQPVYLWSVNQQQQTATQKQIMEVILPLIEQWQASLLKMCQPVMDARVVKFVITGQGALLEGIDTYLQKAFHQPVQTYVPETIGVRDPTLTVALGAFYAYKDLENWRQKAESAVDIIEFEHMLNKKSKDPTGELAISKKLKGFLSR